MRILFFLLVFLSFSFVFSSENCSVQYHPPVLLNSQVSCKRNETYTVIETDPDATGAKCLDGSIYKFLFHEGEGTDSKKFLFYFQGGGFCGFEGDEILESCYARTFTYHGSSNYLGGNGSIYSVNRTEGFVSIDKEINPTFAGWNLIYLIYCDGSQNQGYLEQPVMYNESVPLWFRGFNNTFSVFEYARKNLRLFDAEEVMISGGSSGGAAAIVWASYLQDYFPTNIKLMGVSDGGMFLDVYNSASECHLFRYFFQKLADLINASSSELYGKCKYRGSLDVWKCMLPQYMYKNVEIPFFIANSQHDIIQLVNFNGIYCLDYGGGPLFCNETEQKLITKFRQTHLKVLLKMKKNQPFWGFWLRTCFEHTYHPTWGWYGSTMNVFNAELGISMSFREALDYWYYNLNKPADNYCSFIDIVDWKHNPYCVYDEIYRDQDKSS